MKKIFFYFIIIAVGWSCSDILNKYPLDKVTEEVYWKSSKDLELYCNRFYSCFPDHRKNNWMGGTFRDYNSDNEYTSNYDISLINGKRVIPTEKNSEHWNWENIRAVNYFFENYKKVESDYNSIKQYVGEMYFFKAWYYFELLKRYGDIPWYDKVLSLDSKELYDPRLSRHIITDSIISCLDKAIIHLSDKEDTPQDRFSKDVALAFKARICLYEGTWEKYHAGSVFGVDGEDGKSFLEQAVKTTEILMNKNYGLYIYKNGDDKVENYRQLFIQRDYSENKEILFGKEYDLNINYAHNLQSAACYERGATKSLIDYYLCKNGKPIYINEEKNSLYEGDDDFNKLKANRDPRLSATVFSPGEVRYIDFTSGDTISRVSINIVGSEKMPTGYYLKKGFDYDYSQHVVDGATTGAIAFRYAEVLLIYAEAKAELNQLTQEDLDKSINLLRKRVGMPNLMINIDYTDPNWDFKNISPILNEIRRERRIELAFEGFRYDDIMRWASGDEVLFGKRPKGIKFNQNNYPNVTPGIDVFIDSDGYLDPLQIQIPNGYGFDINRDYLYPLPLNELVLNTNLAQNPGWR